MPNPDIDGQVRQRIGSLSQRLKSRLPAAAGWRGIYHVEFPDILTFADKWLRRPLYAGPQTDFARSIFFADPLKWRGGSPYTEGYAKWGKRGGKDNVFATIATYACAKMAAYLDIWKEFGVAAGTPVAGINVSYNATQAREVFFKYLKSFMRRTLNPATGRNFFEERGLDLREGGKSLQARRVILDERKAANGEDLLCFYSGDSREFTGEGKNLIIALLDELGAFPSPAKAIALRDSLVETAVATFGDLAFIGAASYVYGKNDAMVTVYDKAAAGEQEGHVFRSTFASWESNPHINREKLEQLRRKNPQRFARVYECKLGDAEDQFFKPSAEVREQANKARMAPVAGGAWWIEGLSVDLAARTCSVPFLPFFRGLPGVRYWLHYDLATGKDGRDKVGMALSRTFRDRPRWSAAYLEALKAADRPVPAPIEELHDGIWVELMLQIRALPGREVQFAALLDLAIYLRDVLGFDIAGMSYDGWESTGEQQRAREKGFNCLEISVDRTNEAAERAKELLYSSLLNYYAHPVFLREAEELVYDGKGKVDHPETSNLRDIEEGDNRGSKDVWDGVCGTVQGLLGDADGEQVHGDVDEKEWMTA